ncbi:MAG TPA: hypothetical protein VGW10_19425 [Solirubrobacteraceae bacterium]|nr:hypothetical protein [Solirubrobacteraceae bacterium]
MTESSAPDADAAPAPDVPPPPDSPRVRRMRWAAVAWLVLLGAAAITVGGHDTAVGREIGVRLAGTATLAAGIVLMAGALGLYRNEAQGEALATVAALLGAALGFLMFVAQAVNDDPDSRLVLWGGILVLSVATWWFIRWQMTEAESEKGIFTRLPVLKSTVALGLVVSLVQFWYSSIYLPTRAPVSVTMEPKFEAPKRMPDGRTVLRGTVTVKNTSSTRVIVVGSSLVISISDVPAKKPTEKGLERAEHAADAGRIEAMRFFKIGEPATVARGRFVNDDFFFEPGDTFTRPFVAWVPESDRDLARVDVSVAIARPSVGEVRDAADVDTERTEEGHTVITRPVPEDGWLKNLTRGDRFVTATYFQVSWDQDRFEPFDVAFDRTRSPEPPGDFSDRMRRFYGVGFVDASAVVPLDE